MNSILMQLQNKPQNNHLAFGDMYGERIIKMMRHKEDILLDQKSLGVCKLM
jgi:hypothetical protein